MNITIDEIDNLILRLRIVSKSDEINKRTRACCLRSAAALDALSVATESDPAALNNLTLDDFHAARAIQ